MMSSTRKVDKHGFVVERDGIRYALDRPASQEPDGSVALDQLRSDEIVMSPGIIYRRVSA